MNTIEEKLYNHLLNSKDWKNEAKGTVSKEDRFVYLKTDEYRRNISVHYTNSKYNYGRLNFLINVNGWYLYLNPEMSIKDFKVIVANVR